MEGFKRHEKTTGQNPLKMAEKQNEMIKTQVENLVKEKAKEELEAKVAELRRQNEEKEAELERSNSSMKSLVDVNGKIHAQDCKISEVTKRVKEFDDLQKAA